MEVIHTQPLVTVTHFRYDERKAGGAYVKTTGRVKKIDAYCQAVLMTDGTAIAIADIFGMELVG